MTKRNKDDSSLEGERPTSTPPTWGELGEGFEALGRVGLAMAVGFSAAGVFCKAVEQGRIKLPSMASLLLPPPDRKTGRRQEVDSLEGPN